jgi:nitrite reductase (cytochrome c-552)
MRPLSESIKKKPYLGWLIFLATMLVTFLLGLLASSIMERRTEAIYAYAPKEKIKQFESDNSVWRKNYPREYESYMKTSDTSFNSKYNGNATIDMLEVDPKLVVLWAGYAFSKDYKQGRGHYYAVEDIVGTVRTGAPMKAGEGPQPSTCWTCKSPDVPRLMNKMGVNEFYHTKWSSLGKEVKHPIGCADCHDPETMNLQITRPALVEAFERRGLDIKKVSHQEMRTLVCAQCHVEYYFKGDGKYLTFPWDNGLSSDSIEKYYDNVKFTDWTHGLSKAPMLKAQHPDYEVFTQGIHAQRGLSCADCHMPYISEGGQKFTDHHIQSPLNNISNSCQVCHRQSEEELRKNVYDRQDKIIEARDNLEILLVKAHVEAKFAWDKGAKDEEMKSILQDIRHAQWKWDYVAASHGASFHAPVEVSRIISAGIGQAQEARIKLARLLVSKGFIGEVPYPDISTKNKAQKYIGLDMDKLNADKKAFMEKVVPGWK